MDRAPQRELPPRRTSSRVKLPGVLGLLIATAAGCRGPLSTASKPLGGPPRAAANRVESESAPAALDASALASSGSGASFTGGQFGAENAGTSNASEIAADEASSEQPAVGSLSLAGVDGDPQPNSTVAPVNYDARVPGETVLEAEPISQPAAETDLEELLRSVAAEGPEERSGPSRLPQPAEPSERVELPRPQRDRAPEQLRDLIATALERHPRIQAARRRVAAAANEIPQARALPDPMLNNTFWPIADNALQTAAGRVGHQMGINQDVPWPEKLDARAAVAAREVEVAQAEVVEIEKEIVEAVQLAYYELWYAQRAIEIVEDNQELVDDLLQVSEARYRTGGTQQDVLRAELEADKLEEELIELRRRVERARADLGALVRQPADLMPDATMELPKGVTRVDLMELITEAERCNPTLRGLAAEIARDLERQRLAQLQKYPDFQFGLGWSLVTEDDAVSPVANGHDNINFTVGLTLPVWKEKIAAGIREAANRRASTAQLREAERDRLYGELRRLVAAAEAAIEQIELFERQLIPRTEQTLNLATADYRGERTDFFNLIDIYQELLAFQLQLARTRTTLAGTIVEIERAAGCSLTPNLDAE